MPHRRNTSSASRRNEKRPQVTTKSTAGITVNQHYRKDERVPARAVLAGLFRIAGPVSLAVAIVPARLAVGWRGEHS